MNEGSGMDVDGTIFKVDSTGKETVLHSFGSNGKMAYFPLLACSRSGKTSTRLPRGVDSTARESCSC
jgi:hypothetical protein